MENTPNLFPKGGEITFLMPSTNAIGKLESATVGKELTVNYKTKEDWIAEKDQPKRYFFLGFKTATDEKGDNYYLAKLSNGTETFVCAQTILIQALMNIQFGYGVEITCTGYVKAKGGQIPTFTVSELEGVTLFPDNDE